MSGVRDTKWWLAFTTVLLAVVVGSVVIALDAAGGHPSRSAPLVLWVVFFVVLFPFRLWRRRRRLARDHAATAPPQPEG